MRSSIQALVWEMWASHRRGWLLVLGVLWLCATLYRLFAALIQHSDAIQTLSFAPMIISLILVMAFCDFTDRDTRGDMAGFPRRLFVFPVRTIVLVMSPMAYALAVLTGIYCAWAILVYRPLGIDIAIGWPAAVLATGMVFYQAIIWSLSGFKLVRILVMSLAACVLVSVGCLPWVLAASRSRQSWEILLGVLLAVMSLAGCAAAVIAVEMQRRGGGRGWSRPRTVFDSIPHAIFQPRRAFKSAQQALFWLEWRRNGLILPFTVVLTLALIVGPVSRINGHGHEETLWTVQWLAILPILLAVPIGKGIAKPDFWSLDLAMSSFMATRPVSDGQIIIAKMKAAACSTLLAWIVLLAVTPLWLCLAADTRDLRSIADNFRLIYSPISQWTIPILMLFIAILLTWAFMVNSIWIGLSGRTGLFYSLTSVGMTVFIGGLILIGWCVDHPNQRGNIIVTLVPYVPWILATLFTGKIVAAASVLVTVHRARVMSGRTINTCLCVWIAVTSCLAATAWLISPQVIWLRDLLVLALILVAPLARLGASPLAIAQNRHR
jgi:flagellar biosynthesis protein FliQ